MSAPVGSAVRARILVVSLWENIWALGSDSKAGVSDDDHFTEIFTRNGYELHFLRPRSAKPFDDPRVHTHVYPNFIAPTESWPTWIRRPLWPLLFHWIVTPRALRIARDVHADLVLGHSHYSPPTTNALRRKLRIPSMVKLFGVMSLVHTEWPRAKYVFKNFEQLASFRFEQDAWIVLDDGTRGDDILRANGVPADRIHFLPNGLDVQWADATFDRSDARARFGLPRNARVATFLARLVDSKRPLDFVAAAGRTLQESRDVVFVIAGDGELRGACERAVSEGGLGDRVRFVGSVEHGDVPRLMAASDVFVSTSSLTNRALVTCEAMLCGVPVVVYDTGDTTTLVRDGESGAVLRDGDVVALSSAIERLLCNHEERTRLGENARRVARASFTSWEDRIAMEIEIVEKLLQKPA